MSHHETETNNQSREQSSHFLTKFKTVLQQNDFIKALALLSNPAAVYTGPDHQGHCITHHIVSHTNLNPEEKISLLQQLGSTAKQTLQSNLARRNRNKLYIGKIIPDDCTKVLFHQLDSACACNALSTSPGYAKYTPNTSEEVIKFPIKSDKASAIALVKQGCYARYNASVQQNKPELVTGNLTCCVAMTGYNPTTQCGFLMHLGGENILFLDQSLQKRDATNRQVEIQKVIRHLVVNSSSKDTSQLAFTLTGGNAGTLAYWETYLHAFGFENQVTVYFNPEWNNWDPNKRGSVHFNAQTGEVRHDCFVEGTISLAEDIPASDIKNDDDSNEKSQASTR